jgi:hypothetical protein
MTFVGGAVQALGYLRGADSLGKRASAARRRRGIGFVQRGQPGPERGLMEQTMGLQTLNAGKWT